MNSKEKYINDYNKNNYYSFLVRINKNNSDLISKLESQPSKNGYITSLIDNDTNNDILKLSYIKKTLKEVLSKYNINEIYLFGSYARGEANKNSDVDILCEKGNISTLLEKGTLENELEKKLGKNVDLIFTTSSMPEYFKNKIQEDLIKLC